MSLILLQPFGGPSFCEGNDNVHNFSCLPLKIQGGCKVRTISFLNNLNKSQRICLKLSQNQTVNRWDEIMTYDGHRRRFEVEEVNHSKSPKSISINFTNPMSSTKSFASLPSFNPVRFFQIDVRTFTTSWSNTSFQAICPTMNMTTVRLIVLLPRWGAPMPSLHRNGFSGG